eukprot:132047_1
MAAFAFLKAGNCEDCGGINTCRLVYNPKTDTECDNCFQSFNAIRLPVNTQPLPLHCYVCGICQQQFCYICMVQRNGMIGHQILCTKHFPSFDSCLDEHDMDYRYVQETCGAMGKHCNVWCFIGEIIRNISFMRPGVIVRDIMNKEIAIHFYLDNDSGNDGVIRPKLQQGSLICIRYALKHHFMDMTTGIRLEDEHLSFIKFIPNFSLKMLNDIDATGGLMEYYQNDVLNKRNKVHLNRKCWYGRCQNEHSLLSRCTGCQMALYCSIEHQRKDWKTRHQHICKKIKDIKSLCAVDLNIHSDEKEFVSFESNKKELLHGGLKRYFTKHKGFYSARKVGRLFYIPSDNYYRNMDMRDIFQSMYDRYHQRFVDNERKETSETYTLLLHIICCITISPLTNERVLLKQAGIKKIFDDIIDFDYAEYNGKYHHRLCLIECWKIVYCLAKTRKISCEQCPQNKSQYDLKQHIAHRLDENYKTIDDDINDGFIWWQCNRLQDKIFGRYCSYAECDDVEDPDYDGHGYKMCGGCKMSYYCSRKCQKRDWKYLGHKIKCQALRLLY